MQYTTTTIWRILIAAFVVAIYFFGLGALPLLGPDEPRYAQVAREMLERGDWITPTLGGFNWFEKPALLYWLQIIGYKLFGINEFAARFGSLVFGLSTIATIYLLARHIEKVQSSRLSLSNSSLRFSDIAFLMSASSVGFVAFSRAASFDIILTFPVTAALACFYVSQLKSAERKGGNLSLLGFYVFVGIALIGKGLIGVVLPFGVVIIYQLLSFSLPSKRFIVSLIWGSFVTCAVASAWYAPVILRHGQEFVDEFFIQQHFARYASNKYAHEQPFLYFFLVLPLMILPWLPFAVLSLIPKSRFAATDERSDRDIVASSRLFFIAWLIFPLAFFSFSGSKLPGYILPALPAVILLLSVQLGKITHVKFWRFGVQILAFCVLISIPLIITFGSEGFTRSETAKTLMQLAANKGFANEKVLNLHEISHSLEFYANGRLVRNDDGKLRKFQSVSEVIEFAKRNGGERVLVVLPLDRVSEMNVDSIETTFIADNGALALYAVRVR